MRSKNYFLPLFCSYHVWSYYCITARFHVNCGNVVKHAVSEVIDNLDTRSHVCKPMRDEFSYLQEAFESEFRLGKRGEAALPVILTTISQNL